MQISVIGTGNVGTVMGTCPAELGHQIVFVDRNRKKLALKNSRKITLDGITRKIAMLAHIKEQKDGVLDTKVFQRKAVKLLGWHVRTMIHAVLEGYVSWLNGTHKSIW